MKCIFTILLQIQHEKIIFYLPVKNDKPKFFAFLVFVCTTASFIAQIWSFENFSKGDAILALVTKTVNSQGYSELREPCIYLGVIVS